MEFKAKLFSGSLPIFLDASNLSPQVTFLQIPFHFSLLSPRGQYWVPFYSLCTLSPSQTSFKKKHLSDYHKYAHDKELQKAAPPSDFSQVSRETTACVPNVKVWMNKNKLKLIYEKKRASGHRRPHTSQPSQKRTPNFCLKLSSFPNISKVLGRSS